MHTFFSRNNTLPIKSINSRKNYVLFIGNAHFFSQN